MGCNSSSQGSFAPALLHNSRRNKILSKLPEKHRFHLRKQNPPHGTTSNSKITDLIIKNKQINDSSFRDQFEKSKLLNSKYSDTSFPATSQSLGEKYGDQIKWKCPEEFIEGELLLFGQQTLVKQNQACNHYFASALLMISQNPEIIKRIFQNVETNPSGVYGIWLCIEFWKCVTIDDRIPTNNSAYFTSAGNQICVPLLQKAYAKALGSYSNIETGLLGVCFTNLTGCPYEYLCKDSKMEQNIDDMWNFINQQFDKGFIVAISNQKCDRNQNMWAKSEYSYQILKTTTITIKSGTSQQRLLKIANPWQKYDWTGRWSSKSKTWTPDLKQKLEFKEDDTDFWINVEDMSQNFKQICSCRYQKDYIYSFCRLKFKQAEVSELKGIFLTVNTKNKGWLTVTQKDHRQFDKSYKYGLVRLMVFEINKQEGYLTRYITDYLDATQHLTVSLDLDSGNYYVVVQCEWMYDKARQLVVNYYGSHGVTLIQDIDLPKNPSDLINQMIVIHGKKSEKQRVHQYAGDQDIKRTTGSLAGYIYYHYTNNSKVGRYLQETVILKQKQFLKVENSQKQDEFEVKVDPGQDIIIRLKVEPQGNGFYSYSTKIQFFIIQSYSLEKLRSMCDRNPTKTKKRQIDGKPIQVFVKTFSYSGGIAMLYQNKMDKYAFVQELTLDTDNLILENQTKNEKNIVDIEIQPHGEKLLSFLIQKPAQKVSFRTSTSFYLNTPQFQF